MALCSGSQAPPSREEKAPGFQDEAGKLGVQRHPFRPPVALHPPRAEDLHPVGVRVQKDHEAHPVFQVPSPLLPQLLQALAPGAYLKDRLRG